MVKDSMDLLELLRKRGVNGDVDFLREALTGADGCDNGRRGVGEDRR